MPRSALLAAILVWVSLAGHALAAAWTRAEGTGFSSQSTRVFTTELTSDTDPPFRKATAATYIEYGLYEGVTIGGELDYAARADGAEESLTRAFLRTRFWKDDYNVLSGEFSGGYPVLHALSADNAARDVTPDLRLGLAYGRGLTWGAGGWAEAALSFRKRFQSPADEVKLDLTLGYRPTENIVLMGQVFGTLGLRNEGPFGADYDALKLSVSAGYRITETRTLLLVVAQDVLGRNIDLGTEIGFTIWNEF